MIIYGWNTSTLKQAHLETYECPGCGEKRSVFAVFVSYVHIFWIPFFPYRKNAEIICTTCEYRQPVKSLQPELKGKLTKMSSLVRIPWWSFIGIGAIGMIVAYFSIAGFVEDRKAAQMILEPQVGDVYLIHSVDEVTDYDHYFLKVMQVAEDSIHVSVSSYAYNGVVEQLDYKDGFYDYTVGLHKEEIAGYDESGDLKKVFRNYSAYSGFDRVVEYQPEIDSTTVD